MSKYIPNAKKPEKRTHILENYYKWFCDYDNTIRTDKEKMMMIECGYTVECRFHTFESEVFKKYQKRQQEKIAHETKMLMKLFSK